MKLGKITINRKHEMFWNFLLYQWIVASVIINRKHEMFWNFVIKKIEHLGAWLTVNMKCFEIRLNLLYNF